MNLEQKRLVLAGLIFFLTAIPVLAFTTNNTTLDLSGARQVIAAATREAHRLNAPGGVIAVVDDGGNLIALERLDGTFAAGAHISIGKARTAVIFKRPTKVFEDLINKGRIAMTALNDFTPLQGGMPIEFNGQIIGGIGVSGAASAQQDEEIAIAGAQAVNTLSMSSTPPKTTSFDSQTVSAAFAKGMPLLETDDYKVHASRRIEPGLAEIHTWETDVFYVLEGSATLVTGGEALAPKTIAPGEIRGSAIQGGESRRLVQGDVVIIPKGVPHWFKEIHQAPFLYFVVKPIAKGENQ
jgi:glc operon protein GlcG